MIDSHCHLDHEPLYSNITDVIKRSKEIGLKKILTISEKLQKNYNLDQTREKILIKTRQYAKRQATWARGHMSDWKRLAPNEIKKYIKNF